MLGASREREAVPQLGCTGADDHQLALALVGAAGAGGVVAAELLGRGEALQGPGRAPLAGPGGDKPQAADPERIHPVHLESAHVMLRASSPAPTRRPPWRSRSTGVSAVSALPSTTRIRNSTACWEEFGARADAPAA
jgi:hypothetical protein